MLSTKRKYVIAWTYNQAQQFAKSMDWRRSEWVFVGPRTGEDALVGLTFVVIYEVRGPRYNPCAIEKERMNTLLTRRVIPLVSSGRARLNVVNLP